MATISPVITKAKDDTMVFTWTALTAANANGDPIPSTYADYADRCVHILGTFDAATVVWQGSNDGSNYLTLTDPQGNGISKGAAAIEAITEGALWQRPSTSGGGGSQSVTVICVARRMRSIR